MAKINTQHHNPGMK